MEDLLLEGLSEAQRHAVCVEAAPLCVLAGAGSGKTRVLTRRMAWRVETSTADPRHVLALTFTRKAAGELRSRLAALGIRDQVAAGTFHAIALAQLKRWWADTGQTAPVLLDRKARLLATLLGPQGARGAKKALTSLLADVAGELEWAAARMLQPDHYVAAVEATGRRTPLPAREIAAIHASYVEEKRRRGLVDFDDLLLGCARAIEEDPSFAAAQRWRFRHLFVDEFQDVNPLQARLLAAWLGDRLDLCVVGDANQAIYSWNGADPSQLINLPDRYPSATVVHLDDNYRSSPQVLAVAASVLSRGRSAGRRPELRPTRPDGPVPTVRSFPTDVAEARGIARHLRRARRPAGSWSEAAVLTRTNAQLVLMEEALRAAAIPYRVRGGPGFLQQPEVRAALAAMPAGLLATAVTDLETDLASLPVTTGPELGPEPEPEPDERRQALEGLVRLAAENLSLDPSATTEGFRSWLAVTLRSDGDDGGRDGVELTTFHRAKGLEWPLVFLAGLERGLVPIGHATTPSTEAEERRLLYVAVTRAEVELHCSWAERRTFGRRTVGRSQSPYLEAVETTCRAIQAGGGRVDAARMVALAGAEAARLAPDRRSRSAISGPPSAVLAEHADPGVLESLRSWRARAARASGVPAYVIFHDSTLAALASARPVSQEELLSLPGLGPVKAARYGETLLALVSSPPGVVPPA